MCAPGDHARRGLAGLACCWRAREQCPRAPLGAAASAGQDEHEGHEHGIGGTHGHGHLARHGRRRGHHRSSLGAEAVAAAAHSSAQLALLLAHRSPLIARRAPHAERNLGERHTVQLSRPRAADLHRRRVEFGQSKQIHCPILTSARWPDISPPSQRAGLPRLGHTDTDELLAHSATRTGTAPALAAQTAAHTHTPHRRLLWPSARYPPCPVLAPSHSLDSAWNDCNDPARNCNDESDTGRSAKASE